MTSVNINGINVMFPHDPYEIQKDYMKKVIECLQTRTHAILESPTGTGKTLSLLCSTISWLLSEKINLKANQNNFVLPEFSEGKLEDLLSNQASGMWGEATPRIYYTSRTHTQLSQAMQELKQTVYKDMVKATIMGSRNQMCLRPDVLSEESNTMQIMKCRALVKERLCSFHYGVEKQKDMVANSAHVFDIEDLVKDGKLKKYCPYYMAREIRSAADITFIPYNYVLDPSARASLDLQLRNAVVIFDEAHNVEKTCEESASMQITSTDIALAIDELTLIMKYMENYPDMFETNSEVSKDFTLEDLIQLKSLIIQFEKVLHTVEITDDVHRDSKDGLFLEDLLNSAGIDAQTRPFACNVADKLVQYLSTTHQESFNRNGQNLIKIKEMLILIDSHNRDMVRDRVKNCFKVHFRRETVHSKRKSKKNAGGWTTPGSDKIKKQVVINYWCFNPGFGIDSLLKLGVRNIILTSGTLAPLKPLISELGIDVPIRLENPHIISKKQILVKIMSQGTGNIVLDSCFRNRENTDYLDSLGKTIKVASRLIPEGLLVFFPTYPIMENCVQRWKSNYDKRPDAVNIWSAICSEKPIYVEPRNKNDFNNVIAEYYAQIHKPNSKGACFFAVLRGKVSEGLDFADENGRGVIITGLPFPPVRDPRVILKQSYLNTNATTENEMVDGQKWYTLEAVRTVNQAIGRVIRHKKDYGCILLCDHRFNNEKIKCDLSKWLRGYIETPNTYSKAIHGITSFFQEAKKEFPTKVQAIENSIEDGASVPAPICYSSNETAFGTDMICQKGVKYVDKPTIKDSELSILEDYKTTKDVPNTEELKKPPSSSVLSNLGCQKSSYHFQRPLESNSNEGLVKIHEMNPNKKRKLSLAKSIPMNEYFKPRNIGKPVNNSAISIVQKLGVQFPDKLPGFTKGVQQYKSQKDIFEFIKCVHELLRNCSNSNGFLNDIQSFVKSDHMIIFEKYIQKRMRWDLLSNSQRSTANYGDYLLQSNV